MNKYSPCTFAARPQPSALRLIPPACSTSTDSGAVSTAVCRRRFRRPCAFAARPRAPACLQPHVPIRATSYRDAFAARPLVSQAGLGGQPQRRPVSGDVSCRLGKSRPAVRYGVTVHYLPRITYYAPRHTNCALLITNHASQLLHQASRDPNNASRVPNHVSHALVIARCLSRIAHHRYHLAPNLSRIARIA